MAEIFSKFKELFSRGMKCPACEGTGQIEKPKKEYGVVFGTDPLKASEAELATALLMVSALTLTDKMQVDPATVHVELTFGATGHRVCFNLKREKGASGAWTHDSKER